MTEEKTDALSLTDDEDNEDSDYEPALPEIQGVLSKWTNYLHGWQDRYIVLKEGTLSYYKSENDTAFGCRGAVSLAKASVSPHQFDECRFDVTVNDCVWYLRSGSEEERLQWINAIELHRVFLNIDVEQAESGYGSENNLRRHGSMISLTSAASLSTASTSSFKRGRGLKEKLAEMETFRDILCRQIDTLQSYFDSCASAVSQGAVQELTDPDDIGDPDDLHENDADHSNVHFQGPSGKDLASILQQHGGHAVDFKGESFTFKATTAGIIATLSHCMELMSQREDAWRKRLEKEVERRKKMEEAYKTTVSDQSKPRLVIGGPDFEEGPHCAIKEDEFFDAVDASLDKLEEKVEEEKQRKLTEETSKDVPNIALSPSNPLYQEINDEVNKHLLRMDEKCEDGEDTWQVIAEEGDLKVYKREIEIDGVVVDPLKATHIVTGITGHEVCHYFWDIDVRLEWDVTLESSVATEVHSEDTIVSHNIVKRVWPTSQRDALFWSHIRHVPSSQDETPDRWLVVNVSTNHPKVPSNKFVRVTMNVAMICETIIEPPKDGGDITRENIKCKISYTADVNPGGWAPASVLRAVYKREYPRFLKRFTQFVLDKTKDQPILF
ncbi:ceramide transfer protein-like isoform X1 [Ylistrum balloti]|uniref:ceramide transfer protein-like isoform X1 n=1 Tax=Ylistrum balloti TaxID=509963 RepID=UPI002905877B|nr:ceramide transfer protein-like isoform X1 [Ylistrum balloti]